MLKKIAIISSFVFSSLFLAPLSQAAIIDFDDLKVKRAKFVNRLDTSSFSEFQWDRGWVAYNEKGLSRRAPARSGDKAIVNNFGVKNIGVSLVDEKATFDFNGAYLSAWPFGSSKKIKAQGFNVAGDLIAETDFMTVERGVYKYLQADFDDVYRVSFVGGRFFALDDFTYNEPLTVPEPASLLLLGLGLIGLRFSKKYK